MAKDYDKRMKMTGCSPSARHTQSKLHELTHLIPQNNWRCIPSIIMFILQMSKLRHRDLNLPQS